MASWPMCFDHVFRRLKGVVGSGKGGWYAFCPAHKDEHSQSLTVAVNGKGNLMMRCHAGHRCPIENILAAIDVTFDDLFADNRYYRGERVSPRGGGSGSRARRSGGGTVAMTQNKGRRAEGKFVCAYPYHDEGGRLLFEVVRFADPKEFRQRRPNPSFDESRPPSKDNPQWVWKLKDVRKVPYRLPQLLRDLKERPRDPVALVEGEKDADNARAHGIIATTCPGGAGKFDFVRDILRDLLKGRKVAVVADDDPIDPRCGYKPGLKHALDCCCGLADVAEQVKLIRLFDREEKQDVTDWIEAHEGKGDGVPVRMAFWQAVKAHPAWQGEVPPGAEPPEGWRAAGAEENLFDGAAVVVEAGGDPFADRVAAEEDKQRAKLRGPIQSRDEIIGRLHRMLASLADAANERSDERFLSDLARIAAYARLGGEGISSV